MATINSRVALLLAMTSVDHFHYFFSFGDRLEWLIEKFEGEEEMESASYTSLSMCEELDCFF